MTWDKIQFGTLFSTPSKNGIYKSKEFHGAGVKIINMGEIFAFDFIGNQEMQRISMTESEMKHAGVQNGDLLFARRSLVEAGAGKASIVRGLSEPTTYESSIIRVRLDYTKCNPLFYLYWLRSHAGKTAIGALVTGTNVKGIRGSALKEIYVDHPPLPIQNRIVEILSAYDALIENNQKQIKLLEEAAQRLYKEWFVDLRFPGHETIPIVDGVPEGWKRTNISALMTFHRGYDLTKEEMNNGCYPVVGSTSIIGYHNEYKAEAPGIVTGRSGSLGKYQLIWDDYWPHNTSLYISDYKGHHVLYLYALLQTVNFLSLNNGGAVPTLNRNVLSNIDVIEASTTLQESYVTMIEPMYEKIRALTKSIQHATEMRDRLLPKLMNGELEI